MILGNHDLETVIVNSDLLYDYIHETSLLFFRNKDNRSRILKEFYELNPYIYLVLSTPNMNNEVAILHGGLHDQNGQEFDKNGLRELQLNINKKGLEQITLNDPASYSVVFKNDTGSYDFDITAGNWTGKQRSSE